MWIMMMVALAAWAVSNQQVKPKVAKKPARREPTIGERTFTDKTGLGFVVDPAVQRPKLHAGNGLGSKAKQLEHQREVNDVQEISSLMGF